MATYPGVRRGLLVAAIAVLFMIGAVSACAQSAPAGDPVASSPAAAPADAGGSAGRVPEGFRSEFAEVNGFRMHYVRGGQGSPVVLIHGFPQTWFEWRKQMPVLARNHTVIAVDLRGAGDSDVPEGPYDHATMAGDVHALLTQLGLASGVQVVAHDVGASIAYAYAAQWPSEVSRMVVLEAPIPDQSIYELPALGPDPAKPTVWHFGLFQQPFAETLISGHEDVFTEGFIGEFLIVKEAFTPDDYRFYAGYLKDPQRLRAWMEVYRGLRQDVVRNAEFQARGKLAMPILAIGADGSFGAEVGTQWGQYATDVRSEVIPNCGHWVTEERPEAVTDLITNFLA